VPRLVRGGIDPERWLNEPGLADDELQADALSDLRTAGNKLSVFELVEPLTPERITIAVAAGKEKPADTGYVIFDSEEATALGIAIENTPEKGGTADREVNAFHRELCIGSDSKLVGFARNVIAKHEKEPIISRRVEHLLSAGLESGQLEAKRVNSKLVDRMTRKKGTDTAAP